MVGRNQIKMKSGIWIRIKTHRIHTLILFCSLHQLYINNYKKNILRCEIGYIPSPAHSPAKFLLVKNAVCKFAQFCVTYVIKHILIVRHCAKCLNILAVRL